MTDYNEPNAGIGIRISDDENSCWVILRRDSEWHEWGNAHPIADLHYVDLQTGGNYSALRLAWELLGIKNPTAQQQLRAIAETSLPR